MAPVALVGMACRLPGAENLDDFWMLLREGRSSVAPLPQDRLDRELYWHLNKGTSGRSYTDLAGTVSLRPAAPNVCPLPPELVARNDLFHQTLYEISAAAFLHAGYDPFALPRRNVGVYVGNSRGNERESRAACRAYAGPLAEQLRRVGRFQSLSPSEQEAVVREVAGAIRHEYAAGAGCPVEELTAGAAAATLAGLFGLTGPALAADAACASSFVALQMAARALDEDRIDMALVATASYRNWYEFVLLSQAQSVSATGSYPFDQRADGLVASDGFAAVLVKRLDRALADGDRILGVVRGIGMASDGRGKGFWAPRREGQVAAIRQAWTAGLDPARLQYIEAHATSTQLGDATEMAALTEALGPFLSEKLPVGSVKANIGHTLETAGLASLIKTILAMQHRVVPPAANFQTPNPAIDWDRVPFFVPTTAQAWPRPADGGPRCAAIDSFGIGGLNMHLVIEEPPQPTPSRTVKTPSRSKGGSSQGGSHAVEDDIAIIGVGSVLPDEPVGRIPGFSFDWQKHKLPPRQVARANPLQFLLLTAADQALADAGYVDGNFDRERTATVVGSMFTGDYLTDWFLGIRLPEIERLTAAVLRQHGIPAALIAQITAEYREAFLDWKPAVLDETTSYSCSTLASRLTKQFDLKGGAFALDAGRASGLAVVAVGVDLLRSGQCDLALCAAGQQWTDRLAVKACIAERSVPTEGAGVVLLKRLADARRDGDRIRAIIRGKDLASDPALAEQGWGSGLQNSVFPAPGLENGPVFRPEKLNSEDLTPSRETADALASEIGQTLGAAGMAALLRAISRLATPAGSAGANRFATVTAENRTGWSGGGGTACHLLLEADSPPPHPQTPPVRFEVLTEPATPAPAASNGWLTPAARPNFNGSHDVKSNGSGGRPVRRFVDAPLPEAEFRPQGPALIVGDNSAAEALRTRLREQGFVVCDLPSEDNPQIAFERLWRQAPVLHLFLMTGRDTTDRTTDSARRHPAAGLVGCLWLERIKQAGLIDRASLMAATVQSQEHELVEWCRTIAAETQGRLRVKVLDAPAREPAALIARAICVELAADAPEVEIACLHGRRQVLRTVSQEAAAATPLIDCVHQERPAKGMAWATFDPAADPFLSGHLREGVPLFPSALAFETCAQAASLLVGDRPVSVVRDVQLVTGFRMALPRPHRATVRVALEGNAAHCRLSGDYYNKQGRFVDAERLYQTCTVEFSDSFPSPDRGADAPRSPDFGPPPADWLDVVYPEHWTAVDAAQIGAIWYGPALRCLKAVHHQSDSSWGRLIAPRPAEVGGRRSGDAWQTPTALLDGVLFSCVLFAARTFGERSLSHALDRLELYRRPQPGEECLSRTFYRGRDGRRLTWDFWVLGADGTPVLSCRGAHFVTLEPQRPGGPRRLALSQPVC